MSATSYEDDENQLTLVFLMDGKDLMMRLLALQTWMSICEKIKQMGLLLGSF